MKLTFEAHRGAPTLVHKQVVFIQADGLDIGHTHEYQPWMPTFNEDVRLSEDQKFEIANAVEKFRRTIDWDSLPVVWPTNE